MSNIRAESFFQLVSRMGSERDSKNGKDWTCCCWHWGRWGYFRRHAVYLLKSSCGWHLAGEWRYQTYYERNRFYQQPEWVKKSIAPQSLQEKKKKKKAKSGKYLLQCLETPREKIQLIHPYFCLTEPWANKWALV